MKMAKEYVPIFFDWLDVTQDLTTEEKGNLIDAVVAYASGQEYEHLLSGGCRIAFRFLKGQVDRNNAISDVRSKARANKQEQNESNDIKTEQMISNDIKSEQTESNSKKEKEKEKEKENKKREQEQKQEMTVRFTMFWMAYPRHEGKQNAQRAFEKLKPDESMLETMLRAIERQKQTSQWQESGGQFIPHPATWLNQRRWEDEPLIGSKKPQNVAQDFTQRDYSQEESMEDVLDRLGGQS